MLRLQRLERRPRATGGHLRLHLIKESCRLSSSVSRATFQVLSSCGWPVATVPDGMDQEHFCHQQEQVLDSTGSGRTVLASDSSLSRTSCVAL